MAMIASRFAAAPHRRSALLAAGIALAALLLAPDARAAGVEDATIVRANDTRGAAITVGQEDVVTRLPNFAPCPACEGPPLGDVDVDVRASAAFARGALITLRHYESSSTVFDGQASYDFTLPDGPDLGSGAADCTGTPTTLDDQAGAWWATGGAPPYAGTFRPTVGRPGALLNLRGRQQTGLPFEFTSSYAPYVDDEMVGGTMAVHCLRVRATMPDWVYLPTPWDVDNGGRAVTFRHAPHQFMTRRFRVRNGLTGRMTLAPWKGWGTPTATAVGRITGPARAWQGYHVDVKAAGLKRCRNGYFAYTRLSWEWRAVKRLQPTGAFARDRKRNLAARC
jgi:hypothetical protein